MSIDHDELRAAMGRTIERIQQLVDAFAGVIEAAPAPAAPAVDRVAEVIAERPRQDTVERTCKLCGRVGFRRFNLRTAGWQCSDTIACARRRGEEPAPPSASPKPSAAPGITASCTDCTRTWTLTGRVLDQAVAMHEQKHSHIVALRA
jgi:hypothetical protein